MNISKLNISLISSLSFYFKFSRYYFNYNSLSLFDNVVDSIIDLIINKSWLELFYCYYSFEFSLYENLNLLSPTIEDAYPYFKML